MREADVLTSMLISGSSERGKDRGILQNGRIALYTNIYENVNNVLPYKGLYVSIIWKADIRNST